jgi:photosystem II stability/assembly factor-like uncharacterized protein
MPDIVDSRTPLERTRWFAERAGTGAGASPERFRAALSDTQNIPSRRSLAARVIEEGFEALRPYLGDLPVDRAVMVDVHGGVSHPPTLDESLDDRGKGPTFDVRMHDSPWAFLGIRLRDVSAFEAGALRLVTRQRARSISPIETSGFSTETGILIALITSTGQYQASVTALPVRAPWAELGPTLDPLSARGLGRVTQLDIHPSNGDVLVAGAAGGGVWRTDDGGLHWRPLMDDQPSLTIGAVAFAPSNPDVIYAASGEDASPYNPAWPGLGIYRSSDGGKRWPVLAQVESTRFSEIAVHPWKSRIAYVAGNVGLYKTRNSGRTWRRIAKGRITSVVVDHDDPNRVYIGVYRKGIYRSTNGHHFSRLTVDSQLPDFDHGYIKLDISQRGTSKTRFLIAKFGKRGQLIYTSPDGGNTWTRGQDDVAWSEDFAEWTSVIAVSPVDDDCLYAGQRFMLMRSDHGAGSGWSSIEAGPLGRDLHPDHQDLVFDPNSRDRIYLANDAGVYRSPNKGATWEFASGDLNIAQLHDLDISEQDAEIVACGAQESGVHYRDHSGLWHTLDFRFDCTRVAIDAADSQIVYFSSQFGVKKMIQENQPSLARTTNASAIVQLGSTGLSGRSPFVTIMTLDPNPSIANPAVNRILFLAGNDGLIPHLFRSANGGTSWTRVEYQSASQYGPTGTPFVPEGDITALEFAPGSSSVLYLGTSLGAVYRSANGGAHGEDWQRINDPIKDPYIFGMQISAISAAPDDSQLWVVFAGDGVSFVDRPGVTPSRMSHVYKTLDGGAYWIDASGYFFWQLPDVPTSAVVVDDQVAYPGRAYVGTDTGVFVTTTGGILWSQLGDGLPMAPVTRLRLHRSGRWLFAATMGRGAFRYKLD